MEMGTAHQVEGTDAEGRGEREVLQLYPEALRSQRWALFLLSL